MVVEGEVAETLNWIVSLEVEGRNEMQGVAGQLRWTGGDRRW